MTYLVLIATKMAEITERDETTELTLIAQIDNGLEGCK